MRIVVQAWRALENRTRTRLIRLAWVIAGLLAGVAILCRLHPASGEAVLRFVMLSTGLAMTPVILETLLWISGFAVVGAIAYVRLQMEKREWEQVPVDGGGGGDDRSGAGQEEAASLVAAAERQLESGEVDPAWQTLMKVPRDAWDEVECLQVRIRWAMVAKRWREGALAIELLGGDEASGRVVAEFLMARARDIAAVAETGESGNRQARRAEIRRLTDEAKKAWPEVDGAIRGC